VCSSFSATTRKRRQGRSQSGAELAVGAHTDEVLNEVPYAESALPCSVDAALSDAVGAEVFSRLIVVEMTEITVEGFVLAGVKVGRDDGRV